MTVLPPGSLVELDDDVPTRVGLLVGLGPASSLV